MAIGVIGYKCGMTRYFKNNGVSIPVSVVKMYDNCIIGVKKYNSDNYSVQISFKLIDKRKLNKALIGVYDKVKLDYRKYINEFKVNSSDISNYVIGNKIDISLFKFNDIIDVIGVSKGRGFSGVIRRHNFSAQRHSHGNSRSHRVPGSIGQCQTPGKVFKGKKMPGHMGNSQVTVKNLKLVDICKDENVFLIKGSIPGPIGRNIIIKKKIVLSKN